MAIKMATKHQDGEGNTGNPGRGDTALQEKPLKTKPPAMWQVLMYNDDYTPMEFVVDMLTRVFGHSYERATQIMLMVHTEGRGVCGVYPKDVATMKVEQVMDNARKYEHPLRCGMEEI
jgi:ATP-dependent Clp protease adaptor protein ClpS